MFLSKDFIETAEGLIFAVVAQGTEQGKVLCFLRYVKDDDGWKKVSTEPANAFLAHYYPVICIIHRLWMPIYMQWI